ncbi:hypothetical protein EG327_005067 [Venturia inaequalis]|uniref:Uncharacterized protein n=1 Tax=Venturia inaequalis TaxID=5025 RepID=A0A8H3VAS8_VENIN|nr:hypothetical protein EG327_005067 [Venturia inaequalis]
MSYEYTWEEAEAWAKRKQSIDNWRKEVAYSAQPVVIPTRDPSFRKGVPAPIEVSVDDEEDSSFADRPQTMVDILALEGRKPGHHHERLSKGPLLGADHHHIITESKL